MSTDVSGLAKEAASLVKNVLQQEWTSLPEGQRSRHHLWGLEKIVGMHNLLSLSDDDLARFLNCYGPTMLKLIINQTDMSQLSPEELVLLKWVSPMTMTLHSAAPVTHMPGCGASLLKKCCS
jgi:hypothetical protein